MAKFTVGDKVTWEYQGGKTTSGEILKIQIGDKDKKATASVGTNNSQITKPASEQAPAYLIKTKTGRKVIHNEHELTKA